MTVTAERMRAAGAEGQGSQPTFATRDKLAARLRRLDRDAPEALDLLALAIDAAHEELRGVAGLLAGPRGADHFRRVLRGEEAGISAELARLALDPRREARAAVRAYLDVVAGAIGYHLDLNLASPVEIHEAHAGKVEADARLSAELVRASADGVIDSDEIATLKVQVAEDEARIARLRASLAQAEARMLRRPMAADR